MKKGLFLSLIAVLLLIPFINVRATANVEITKIELIEASEGVVVNEEPTANGLNINFNLAFGNLNDIAKYKVTIKNNDEESYTISSSEAQISDYMNYEFTFADDSNIIEGNSEKELTITITYENEVPVAALTGGKYTETNNVDLTLTNTEAEVVPAVENPKTGDKILLYVDILIVSILLCGLAIKTRKVRKGLALALVALAALPLGVKALEELTIKINTAVEISKDRQFCFKYDYFSDENEQMIDYVAGDSWEEYASDGSNNFEVFDGNKIGFMHEQHNSLQSSRLESQLLEELAPEIETDQVYFVSDTYRKCLKEADAEINAILNGRNFEDLTEAEQNQLIEISDSEEYNQKLDSCKALLNNERDAVLKDDEIKHAGNGCYTVVYPVMGFREA